MTKISNLYTLTNYISANSSGNVVISAPASGYALDVTGTGRFTSTLQANAKLFLQRASAGADTLVQFKNEVGADRAYIKFGGTNEELSFYAGGGGTENLKIASTGAATFSSSVTIGDRFYQTTTGNGQRTTWDISAKNSDGSLNNWNLGCNISANNLFQIYGSGNPLMAINQNGNVGIGTTSPSYGLDIQSASSTGAYLNITKTGYASAFIQPYNDGVYMGSFNSYPLYLRTNNSTVMTLTASGNVGIGTTSPNWSLSGLYALQIVSSSMYSYSNIGGLAFNIRYNSGWTNVATGGGSNIEGDGNSNLVFSTSSTGISAGASTTVTERMRITSAGNLLVGGTADTTGLVGSVIFPGGNIGASQENPKIVYVNRYSTTTSYVHYAGNWMSPGNWGIGPDTNASDTTLRIGIVSGNSLGFYFSGVYASLKGASFPTTSDYRIKENVVNSSYGLSEVLQLRPVKYNSISQGEDGNKIIKSNFELGFIAHEVQEVIPEVVNGVKDAVDINNNPVIQSLEYSRLTAILVKAIQELSAKVTALENK